jgi:hypothetical protein
MHPYNSLCVAFGVLGVDPDAWNEFGEGGITAPPKGDGYMKEQTTAKVFGRT